MKKCLSHFILMEILKKYTCYYLLRSPGLLGLKGLYLRGRVVWSPWKPRCLKAPLGTAWKRVQCDSILLISSEPQQGPDPAAGFTPSAQRSPAPPVCQVGPNPAPSGEAAPFLSALLLACSLPFPPSSHQHFHRIQFSPHPAVVPQSLGT